MPTFLLNLIPGILKGAWNLGSQWLENKRLVSEAKGQIEAQKQLAQNQIDLARLQGSIEKAKQEGSWELSQSVNSAHSLKDELWTFILALPIFLVTISPIVDLIMSDGPYQQGSLVTAAVAAAKGYELFPDWYVYLVFVAVGSAFGVRIWDRFGGSSNGKTVIIRNTNEDPQTPRVLTESPQKEPTVKSEDPNPSSWPSGATKPSDS